MNDELPEERGPPIPVSVITGFLGSGKTTLLNRLLGRPEMRNTAALINEFGEVGLDHILVRKLDEDIVLLSSGCLCCTVRDDLVKALRDLLRKRAKGDIPAFERVVIETTGLADPAPILHTLMTDAVLGSRYRIDGIVTTVDAVNGMAQLDAQYESVKQAAVADRIVLTKSDIADAGAVAALSERLAAINPAAPILPVLQGEISPDRLFDAGLFDPRKKSPDVARWLREEAYAEGAHDHHGHDHTHGHDHGAHGHAAHAPLDVNRHDDRIRAFCLSIDTPVPWEPFVEWIDCLVTTQGENLLRIKGVLNVVGEERPLAVHGVQHIFHPPTLLPAWPDADRRSRLVFITRDIGRAAIADSYAAMVGPLEADSTPA